MNYLNRLLLISPYDTIEEAYEDDPNWAIHYEYQAEIMAGILEDEALPSF